MLSLRRALAAGAVLLTLALPVRATDIQFSATEAPRTGTPPNALGGRDCPFASPVFGLINVTIDPSAGDTLTFGGTPLPGPLTFGLSSTAIFGQFTLFNLRLGGVLLGSGDDVTLDEREGGHILSDFGLGDPFGGLGAGARLHLDAQLSNLHFEVVAGIGLD